MQQSELFPVPNPCIGVCQSNAKGYCMGCLRSRTERQKWNDFMPVEKMRVIELCDLRKEKLEAVLALKKERDAMIAQGMEPPPLPVKPKSQPKPDEQGEAGEGSLDLF